jgi:sulfur carrier protein
VIVVNGQPAPEARAGDTLTALLARMSLDPAARGVAIAVDGEVVPRSGWREHVLDDGARVEILTATQGG